MTDNYLWDRSGQPDQEIQELEETLGSLRYQPRELEIPESVQTSRSPWFLRGLAIAAAIALVVMGLGIWSNMQKRETANPSKAEIEPPKSSSQMLTAASPLDEKQLSSLSSSGSESGGTNKQPERRSDRKRSSSSFRSLRATNKQPALRPEELAEGAAAKDDLMMAFRLASSKLNFAQKKAQSANTTTGPNQNQHKIG